MLQKAALAALLPVGRGGGDGAPVVRTGCAALEVLLDISARRSAPQPVRGGAAALAVSLLQVCACPWEASNALARGIRGGSEAKRFRSTLRILAPLQAACLGWGDAAAALPPGHAPDAASAAANIRAASPSAVALVARFQAVFVRRVLPQLPGGLAGAGGLLTAYLPLLLAFTLGQPEPRAFRVCLASWAGLSEQLLDCANGGTDDVAAGAATATVRRALAAMATALLRRVQHRIAGAELAALSDTVPETDEPAGGAAGSPGASGGGGVASVVAPFIAAWVAGAGTGLVDDELDELGGGASGGCGGGLGREVDELLYGGDAAMAEAREDAVADADAFTLAALGGGSGDDDDDEEDGGGGGAAGPRLSPRARHVSACLELIAAMAEVPEVAREVLVGAGAALAECVSLLVAAGAAAGGGEPLLDACTLLRLLCALCPGLDAACTPGTAGATEASAREASAAVLVRRSSGALAIESSLCHAPLLPHGCRPSPSSRCGSRRQQQRANGTCAARDTWTRPRRPLAPS